MGVPSSTSEKSGMNEIFLKYKRKEDAPTLSPIVEGGETTNTEEGTSSSSSSVSHRGNEVICLELPESFAQYKKKSNFPYKQKETRRLTPGKVLGEGGVRRAFEVMDTTHSEPVEMAFKVYLRSVGSLDDEFRMVHQDLQAQSLAAFMAMEFTKLATAKRVPLKKVRFLKAKMAKLSIDGEERWGLLEKKLNMGSEGYIKWINNTNGKKNYTDPNFSATMEAFAHFTYDVTGGYLMITDLQGVKEDGENYILSDPAIHCKDMRFGFTNLLTRGFDMFFQTHKCNRICQTLSLRQNVGQKTMSILNKGTGAV